ncbi:MAG: PQQ-binding-like beta-propeller repeat protein [Clostridia bacterium]|nr:PQQ-binding-like beta-propeller repeat protein [Clostridia bacterium]
MKKQGALLLALIILLPLAAFGAAVREEEGLYEVSACEAALPEALGITDGVYEAGEMMPEYEREADLTAQADGEYAFLPDTGVYAFRSDNYRRNAAFGTAEIAEGAIIPLWEYPLGGLKTAESGTLYGVGWNSQPAVVKWAKEVRAAMAMYPEAAETAALCEVIFAAQDGKVYFLNLADGTATRDPISIGFPMKGSVSVDAMGRPMIAFGQAISKMPRDTGEIGLYLYDLLTMQPLYFLNGRKTGGQVQYSSNGAFDSSALFISRYQEDAIVVAGENGLLYTVDLNTDFRYSGEEMSLSVEPVVTYMNSIAAGEKENRVSIEGAASMADRYVFTGDAWGIVRCVDTTTMRCAWAVDFGDNVDAAMALDPMETELSLYVGTTCYARSDKKAPAVIARVNALTGEILWRCEVPCVRNASADTSGCKASPVIGERGLSDFVYFTVNEVSSGRARLHCLEKETGEIAWSFDMASSVSSPVAVYSEFGSGVIVQCASDGHIYMLNGRTGDLIASVQVDGQFEGSPAVYRDRLVIGTCDKNAKMYCFLLK